MPTIPKKVPKIASMADGVPINYPGASSINPAAGNLSTIAKRSNVFDVVHETMISGMLSNFTGTHVLNAADNTVKAITAPLETATRAMLSIGRKPENKTYMREAAYQAFGIFSGFNKGLRYTGARIKANLSGQGDTPEDTLSRMGVNKELAGGSKVYDKRGPRQITGEGILGTSEGLASKSLDAVGAMINVPGTALNHADIVGKLAHYDGVNYSKAAGLHAQGKYGSFREAFNAVSADPDMAKKAVQTAREWTYQGDPDSYVKWILSDSADGVPGLRWVIPFRRAIANLFEHTLERSPLIISSPTLMKKLISKDPVIADAARAKFVFGMSALTSLSMLTDRVLTGAAPEGSKNREAWLRIHGKEDTLTIAGKDFDLRNFGAYGNMMRVVARYNQWNINKSIPEFEDSYSGQSDKYLHEFGQFVSPIVDVMYDNHWGKNMVEFFAVVQEAVEDQDYTRLAKFFERNIARAVPVAGQASFIGIAKQDFPYATRSDRPGDILASQVIGLRELIPVNYSWDGFMSLHSSMMSGVSGTKRIHETYGPPDKFDKLVVKLGVEFPETPRYVTSTSPQPGENNREFYSPAAWKEINEMRRYGFAGIPGVKEFIKSGLLDTKYFKGMAPQFQKWEIEAHYSIYVNMLNEYHKGMTTAQGEGVGARLQAKYMAQLKVMRRLKYGDKR